MMKTETKKGIFLRSVICMNIELGRKVRVEEMAPLLGMTESKCLEAIYKYNAQQYFDLSEHKHIE